MFIARQAIFDRSMNVYGYELLHRDSAKAKTFNPISPNQSTANVLNGLFELGIDNISSNKKSFINFNYDFLFSDSIELIEPENLIIEVLEHTKIDDRLITRLTELRKKGYKIALDDFVEDVNNYPLIPIAHIIKFDLIETPLHLIRRDVQKALANRKVLVAEKVETEAEFEQAKKMGFHLFQGFFFQKPNIVGQTSSKKSPKLSYMRIIDELNQAEPSFTRLTAIIKTDVNLVHRLLLTTKENKVDSEDLVDNIKQSLVFMGLKQLKRWINILILQDLSTDKADELTQLSLVRAKFGELLAENCPFHARKNEIYGMFLFSTLDALLDQPIEQAIKDIDLTEDVKRALIDNDGKLCPFLHLVYAYEKGDWKQVKIMAKRIKVDQKEITNYYMEAITYAQDITDSRYNRF